MVAMFRSTPPREGRLELKRGVCLEPVFRSTPPREGRRPPGGPGTGSGAFRSTPPREGRPLHSDALVHQTCFDPRPHARGDDVKSRLAS